MLRSPIICSWRSPEQTISFHLLSIVKNLAENFPNLGVVVDGFTRTDINGILLTNEKEEEIIKQEKDFSAKITAHLPEGVKFYSLIGRPMYEVMAWAYAVDLYFVPNGSGLAKILILANRPGVVHGNNKQFWNHPDNRENCQPPVFLPHNHQSVDEPKESELSGNPRDWSYDFNWRVAYEELLKIASSLKRD